MLLSLKIKSLYWALLASFAKIKSMISPSVLFSTEESSTRKEECEPTLLSLSLQKEFYAGCQPRHPVKMPITTWKSLSPPRGLQLYLSCQARCPFKTSNETESYPAPSAAQLFTMLFHRGISVLFILYIITQKLSNLFFTSLWYNICFHIYYVHYKIISTAYSPRCYDNYPCYTKCNTDTYYRQGNKNLKF